MGCKVRAAPHGGSGFFCKILFNNDLDATVASEERAIWWKSLR
jgi:hypothetical protein